MPNLTADSSAALIFPYIFDCVSTIHMMSILTQKLDNEVNSGQFSQKIATRVAAEKSNSGRNSTELSQVNTTVAEAVIPNGADNSTQH